MSAGPRLTVAIPAKNEASSIGFAIDAFGRQRALDGSLLDADTFEVLILANDCVDATAQIARSRAHASGAPHVIVISSTAASGDAHVGVARRTALDLAVERQMRANGDRGMIASTDADSIVDDYWVAQTLAEFEGVDAVAGHVEIARAERDRMDAPVRLLYDRERSYRSALGDVEAWLDPRPYDPPSRHDAFVGTSFAVRVETYLRAGRLPPLPRLEDVAFAYRLRGIDARIRHSYAVRVETSGRASARVEGGFGSFIDDLRVLGARRESHRVEHARRSIARATTRAYLRACWAQGAVAGDLDVVARLFGCSAEAIHRCIERDAPFGTTLDRLDALGPAFESIPDQPVEEATAQLRRALRDVVPNGTRQHRRGTASRRDSVVANTSGDR